MAAVRKLRLCAVSPTGKHSASVIFLHGSGDTGQGLRSWVRDMLTPDLAFSHIRVIYPTAPARPYTPMRGALSTVWFDRYKISRDCPEHLESIDAMCSTLGAVIEDEVNAGIPAHRIIVGMDSLQTSRPEEASPWVGPWPSTWRVGTTLMSLECLLSQASSTRTRWLFRPLKTASRKASPSPRCSSATAPRMSWCSTDGERRPRRCCRRLA